MKILIVSPKNKTVFNFRGELVKDMISYGNEVLVTGPNQDYLEDIMALGVSKFVEVPLVKDNTSIIGDLTYLDKLKKVIKHEKPDFVFCYTIKPVIYGSIAARTARVPHIYAMVTGLGRIYTSRTFKAKVLRCITKALYRNAFKCCKRVIFQNSDDIKDLVKQRYLPQEKAEKVDGSGVNMERFTKSPLPEKPVFLMVSRIIREKGVMEYCNAARILKQQHPEARCILLGGFDASIGALSKDDIQPFIDDGSIEYPGEVKDPVSFYQQSSFFILPSYYREGLPRTILEAMAMGRPVITTDWPGCRDAVEDGVNGLLTEPKNPETLAKKMCWIIEHPEEAKKMAEAGYERCRDVYDVKVVNKSMLKIMVEINNTQNALL